MSMDMGSATASAAMPAATDHDMESMEDMMGGCKISVSATATATVLELTNMAFIDAVELEHDRRLFHLRELAHHEQRHVRRILHRRALARHVS